MIHIHQVSFSYSGNVAVLDNISLHLEPGGVHILAGANGSGKSTLLALMAGLYLPKAGWIGIDGKKGEAIRDLGRLVLQESDLQILGATPAEDLLLGCEEKSENVTEARAMADLFQLLDYWDKPVQTLSGGMKRKLCLAAALLDRPQVLLLDEPLSGLDYPAVCEMRRILRRQGQEGMTQVVAVHDLDPVIDLADTLTVLASGRLVLHGSPETVLAHVREYGVRPPATWQAGLGIRAWDEDDV